MFQNPVTQILVKFGMNAEVSVRQPVKIRSLLVWMSVSRGASVHLRNLYCTTEYVFLSQNVVSNTFITAYLLCI